MLPKLLSYIGNDTRTSLLKRNIIVSFLLKGWSGIVMVLLVPLTLKCLGEYTNGVWLTISSILIWIDNLDIGLGNGLRNKLAFYLSIGEKSKAHEVVTTSFALLTFIIIPIMLSLLILTSRFDLYSFLNVNINCVPDLYNTVNIAIILVCMTFIFKLTGNFYLGLQLPALNNLFQTCSQTLILIATYIAYINNCHSLTIIAIINMGMALIIYISAYIITFHIKYKEFRFTIQSFNRKHIKELFSIGIKFFIIQISGILLFMSSNLLISKLLSPAMVTPYQITYRYFTIALMIFNIASIPFWSAITDAFGKKDMTWIIKAKKATNKIIAVAMCAILIMTLCSKWIFSLWIGDEINIPLKLTVSMAIYMTIIIYSMGYSNFLNGFGALRLQIICTVCAATLFIPLVYTATRYFNDIYSIIYIMILVNIPGLIINKVQVEKIIKGKALGIWKI